MYKFIPTLVWVFTVANLTHEVVSDCVWSINKDLPYKDAVFFRREGRRGSRGRLLVPSSAQGLQLKDNETLEMFCPGTGNYIQQLGREEVQATCAGGLEVFIDGLKKSVKELGCAKDIVGDVQQTQRYCSGRKGRVLSVGYASPAGWLQLFEVCYDITRSITLYAYHMVSGTAMAGAYVGNDRPGFKSNGLPTNVSVAAPYKRKAQLKRFSRLLGNSTAQTYINKKSFLSRGHLAADADFLMHSWQRTTYFYANVVPQWQSINGGNWAKLESAVRNAAIKMNKDLKVWTGSDGTLELEDENNNNVMIFLLQKNQLPVPKFIWKIVCSDLRDCIAFVVLNNPFAERLESVCENVCRETNWYQQGYDDIAKGAVSCCDVRDLNNTLRTLPTITINGILRLQVDY